MSSVTGRACVATAIVSSIVSVTAQAQRADEVVVTAARIEQPLDQVIGATSVITRQDIQRRQALSVAELLRSETGLSVVNNGGIGKLTNVYVRGADAEQVLVLIDGVRAGSATSGTMAFEYLPVDQIERIEIVRGPRSSIYGSDAIGGVIQIFTRRNEGLSVSLASGSDDTYDATAGFGLRSENSWLSVSGNHLQTDGINSCTGAPFPPGGGCYTVEPDDDGYRSNSGALRAGRSFGDKASIEASALYTDGRNEYDGSFTNRTDFVNRAFALSGRIRPSDTWSLQLSAGETRDVQDNLYDDPADSTPALKTGEFDTTKRSASLQSDWTVRTNDVLSVGVDYVDDIVASSTEYEATSRDNLGAFAQYQLQLGAHQLLASARRDDNEQFGGYTTGSVGWRWNVSDALAVHTAWGTAFGAPTFNDLYYPGFSNPDLDPEESRNVEAGVSGQVQQLRWSLTGFQNDVSEQIVYDASIFAPNNLNEARIRGLEAEAATNIGDWSLSASYTLLDARNRSPGPAYDNHLPRRANHLAHLDVGHAFGPLDVTARLSAESARYDDVANTHRVPGFAVLDLLFNYALDPHWSVQTKLANALDREYQVVRYYNQDDRSVLVTVRYQP